MEANMTVIGKPKNNTYTHTLHISFCRNNSILDHLLSLYLILYSLIIKLSARTVYKKVVDYYLFTGAIGHMPNYSDR